MNRRQLLSLPLVGALPLAAIVPQTQSQETPERILTEHQKAVLFLLQRNMRSFYTDPSWGVKDLPRDVDDLIDLEFPREFKSLQILDLVGVHAATSPCSVHVVKNKRLIPRNPEYASYYPYEDARAVQDCVGHQNEKLKMHGFRLDSPKPEDISQISYMAPTAPLESTTFSQHLDRAIVRTMAYYSEVGTWDRIENFGKFTYILANPEDAYKVKLCTGISPIETTHLPKGNAIIGFKEDEYHASAYVMPYVPIQLFRAYSDTEKVWQRKAKTRYGVVLGNYKFHGQQWLTSCLWNVAV